MSVCEREHACSFYYIRVKVCVCRCMCVPIPFHLIKPWLQQPHTLVCRTQPFITGLEPFTAGFMGASAGPQGHHSRGRGRSGNGGRRERRNESGGGRWVNTEGVKMEETPPSEGGWETEVLSPRRGLNLLGGALCFIIVPPVINILLSTRFDGHHMD